MISIVACYKILSALCVDRFSYTHTELGPCPSSLPVSLPVMASTVVEPAKPFADVRDKALIHEGEECKLKSMELFEAFGLPGGLLPLEDVIEGGYVEETGFVWMSVKKKQQHHFKKADRLCSYSDMVSCYLKPKRMTKITGVKAKDMMLWVPVNEIYVDDAAEPKIHFKSLAGLSRSFSPDLFGRGA